MSARREDYANTPEFRRWANAARTHLAPLDRSALTMALITPGSLADLDIKQAVELGATLLLGKPLVLCVTPGAKAPPGLAKAADAIVEVDEPIDAPSNAARLAAAIAAVTKGTDDDD